jgi:SpoVK/Ycf46/Vps4 family AAA+-type ATPase
MARSDLLITLVKAGITGDRQSAKHAAEAIIAEERAKQHTVLAERLSKALETYANGIHGNGVPRLEAVESGRSREAIAEVRPQRRIEDLWLPDECRTNVEQLVEEQRRSAILRAHGLDPRNRVLLVGPPGNGKTSLAEGIAEALAVPLFVVRYESMIGSYLGETAGRLKRVFDYARTTPCVLFFDEFDAVGKERGDVHETGEIKRVVTSLLMQIDDLPTYTIVVAATNHAELLDRAVWRRFQLRLALPPPTRKQLLAFFERYLKSLDGAAGTTAGALAKRLGPLSYAEAEEFVRDLRRRLVLEMGSAKQQVIIERQTRLWERRVQPHQRGDESGDATDSEAPDAEQSPTAKRGAAVSS